MSGLTTSRLFLIPLDRAMLAAWMAGPGFSLECATPQGPRLLEFPAEWPGDAAAMFPAILDGLGPDRVVVGSFAIVEQDSGEVVGMIGTKGGPDSAGCVEIGYGINRKSWGLGIASESVVALVEYLRAQPGVRCITAETAVGNLASQRVLTKAGFLPQGRSWSSHEGALINWELRVA